MKLAAKAAGAALALAVSLVAAHAGDYPDRPIAMVISYGPGGATDISARTLAEPLGNAFGSPLVMVNKTGAGGATGSVAVQHAKADGYTLLFARVGRIGLAKRYEQDIAAALRLRGSHSVNPAMKATLPYGSTISASSVSTRSTRSPVPSPRVPI